MNKSRTTTGGGKHSMNASRTIKGGGNTVRIKVEQLQEAEKHNMNAS
jgi:hypothetical protein